MPPCPWLAKQRDDAVKQILGQRKDEALHISSRRKRHEMGEVRTIVFRVPWNQAFTFTPEIIHFGKTHKGDRATAFCFPWRAFKWAREVCFWHSFPKERGITFMISQQDFRPMALAVLGNGSPAFWDVASLLPMPYARV